MMVRRPRVSIAFEIPIWLLWLIGIPVGLFILLLAFVGFMALWTWKDFHL